MPSRPTILGPLGIGVLLVGLTVLAVGPRRPVEEPLPTGAGNAEAEPRLRVRVVEHGRAGPSAAISGSAIEIREREGGPLAEGRTDARGLVEFPGISPRVVDVAVHADGWWDPPRIAAPPGVA